MATISARWTQLVSSSRLRRSSHILSVNTPRAWVFGGELLPRQPVDNALDLIDMGAEPQGIASCLLSSFQLETVF